MCTGKHDGFYIAFEDVLTTRYKICKDERTIHVGFCNGDKIWGGQTFPYNGKCTHIYALPFYFNWRYFAWNPLLSYFSNQNGCSHLIVVCILSIFASDSVRENKLQNLVILYVNSI